RDVLGFHASEVAASLATTEESVTSALKRARATMHRHFRSTTDRAPAPAPGSAAERELVTKLTRAYETGDVDKLVDLLTDDVLLSMPPIPVEYLGRDLVAGLLAAFVFQPGHVFHVVPTRANGQPAFGMYLRETPDAVARCQGVMVFGVTGNRV